MASAGEGAAMPEDVASEDEVGTEDEDEEVHTEDEEGEAMGKDEDNHQEANVEITVGVGNVFQITESSFEELVLPDSVVDDVQGCWDTFLRSADSREAAGEAIYAALFDAAPSLQSLFKTPRAVMAMRFMNGLNSIILALKDPKACKILVETLGFQHLDLEVTTPRVAIFQNAIVDLLTMELGVRFSKRAREGWQSVLNWVGGAYIFVRLNYADRLRILASSWATANKKASDVDEGVETGEDGEEGESQEKEQSSAQQGFMSDEMRGNQQMGKKNVKTKKKKKTKGLWGMMQQGGAEKNAGEEAEKGSQDANGESDRKVENSSVPTTYNDMFMFNAAVMGFGSSTWMNEVLASFDTIVTNVSNSYRLQEECDVLSLRIAKYKGTINLSEYKAVMLASLRSLVPKDWNSAHEVAWSWLWENVERIIKGMFGKPSQQQKALEKLYKSMDESMQSTVRREVYSKFFALAPAGQDFFKQSTTRLHFIADKVLVMTLDIYIDPKKMVEDISALGLRHVGYGIPTDLFGPFVTACVQVIRSLTDDDLAEESFRWSLSLISRILTRVINEGSTIVMKAINMNSAKMVKKAVGCAPRGRRAMWMLNIQVGTQSISPLLWAIETGSLEAAKTMIMDLLTIRADRDHYYYGMESMFERHSDIVKRLSQDAPALLPVLLDGLIWRSRLAEAGQRRVNYYVKHMLLSPEGGFSKCLEWITESKDPKIVTHPVIVLVTDIVWTRVAFRTFLYGKSWFLFTLLVFLASQAILRHTGDGEDTSLARRIAVAVCRCFIYLCCLSQFLYFHCKHMCSNIRTKRFTRALRIPLPEYLASYQNLANFSLTVMLVLMLITEPVLWCLVDGNPTWEKETFFSANCPESADVQFPYSILSMAAVILYFSLCMDLAVFNTWISAFVLVCSRVLAEVGLFLVALSYFILSFSCAVSALEQSNEDYGGIHKGALSLLEVAMGMYSGSDYSALHKEPALMVSVIIYLVLSVVFLLNLLIAQLNCSYAATFQDMFGFARLNRGKIVIEAMPAVSSARWAAFVRSLALDARLEFNEGDIGLSGGVQITEPAAANPTTIDMIKRFGGSTSPNQQWPEEDNAGNDAEDRVDRVEKMIEKIMKRAGGPTKGSSRSGGSGLGSSLGGPTGSSGDSGKQASNSHSDSGGSGSGE